MPNSLPCLYSSLTLSLLIVLSVSIVIQANGGRSLVDSFRNHDKLRQQGTKKLLTFDLQPTVDLKNVEKLVHRRRLLSIVSNSSEEQIENGDELLDEHRHLHEFYATRHLSRYEMHHRTSNDLELNLNWDGTYTFEEALEENVTSTNTEQETSSRRNRQHRRLQESAYGGQFDNYQAVPLSQGYGTHFANVWVGTPTPQRKTVIVDTGSHYTAFPCSGCKNCGAPHHTDPYFNPQRSRTFRALQCDECRDGVSCYDSQCRFSQSYTEGSSWEAVQVVDRFYCGGNDILDSVEPKDEKFSIEFMFGCQTSMTGLFITQLADGIMGMSAHPATLPKQLFDKGIIEHNLFAMCFRRELGTSKRGVTAGSMTLGGFSTALDTSPMVYAKNMASSGWFTVFVKNIYIRSGGGQSATAETGTNQKTIRVRIDPGLLNSGKGVIVDSGTTDSYLNKAVAKEFNKAWKRATGRAYSHSPIRLTRDELRSLPTILIQCHAYTQKNDPSIDDYSSIPGYTGQLDPNHPNDLLIAIPATSYMDYSPVTKMYTSRVYFTETAGGVLGSNAMQGHNVVFDWENGRIGFAESSCSYDKKDVPKAALDEGYSTACLVGNPVVTQSCIETVDRRLCKHNPTNIALLGTETFTAIVESPGTGSGASCVESAKEARVDTRKVIDEPVIKCAGDGVCEEYRPCQLTCAEAERAAKVAPVQDSSSECGDSYWSACDYGCMQSRIVSVKYSDGLCHEVSRRTRPCHIGACARSDPCRVPFLVHAVFGFRGGDVTKWSLESEDNFVLALTRASATLSGTKLFDEGDVNVLAVLPWYKDDDDAHSWRKARKTAVGNRSKSSSQGIKVVLEISVFNAQARVHNATYENEATVSEQEGTLSSLVRNLTARFSVGEVKSTCHSDDLFQLAKKALVLKKEVLQHEQLLPVLLNELSNSEGDRVVDGESAFQQLFHDTSLASTSRLLSVWSIRTEIDEEINYFGPPRPWWFRILALAHTSAFIFIAFMLVSTACSLLRACCEAVKEESLSSSPTAFRIPIFPRSPRHHRYSAVSLIDDETVEDAIMGSGSPSCVELAENSPGLRRYSGGTTPKKRRSTVYSQQLSDL